MKASLIVAAGGASRRFRRGRKKPKAAGKLFLSLGAKPLLAHALAAFREIPAIREILIALPPGTKSWVRKHVLNGHQSLPVRLVRGGKTRAESVRNALLKTSPRYPWVLVHDGARPFPPRDAILKLLRKPPQAEGVILGRPVVSTLKRISAKGGWVLETVDRSFLFEAETPQLVKRSFLLKAYRENPNALKATDEASLLESVGGKVKVIPHSGWNVKVTTPQDLELARAVLTVKGSVSTAEDAPAPMRWDSKTAAKLEVSLPLAPGLPGVSEAAGFLQPPEPEAKGGYQSLREAQGQVAAAERLPAGRQAGSHPLTVTGFGRDTHRLVRGRKFYLGGVRIPFEKGALGHSDGDTLLHAVSDALLGGAGLGDIGEWFSDQNPRYKNIRSEVILKKILSETRERGWVPMHLDTVIILERPRLGPHKKAMRKKLAKWLGLGLESVSVKAKTQEGLGPEGEGRAVTCEALVTMRQCQNPNVQ